MQSFGGQRPWVATGGATREASAPPRSKIGPQWVRGWARGGWGIGGLGAVGWSRAAADYFKELTVRVDARKRSKSLQAD